MGHKGHRTRKKVKLQRKGHPPQKIKIKPPTRHNHAHIHSSRHPRPRTRKSEVFHDNCCKYKIHTRIMRRYQVDLATQCPSRTISLATSVPLLQHPVRRKVLHLPETVVMHMRNMEDARRVAISNRRTLIQTHVSVPDGEAGSDPRQIDRRLRQVYRRGRERPLSSSMDMDDLYTNPFQ
ncbi:uncharacterized protein LOC6531796 [Drosophila yakuba]|uniref:Uncharacterized protein n=1 Tax=Drosophila yakuba TaxID=7245 RepID=B4P955_DROYA|nr:uncharacterized protein LOC6531796 [Drosophila yakuba]EDW92295.2 uncharacterized protein Dyak_GE14273 [Drosophila yakuba]